MASKTATRTTTTRSTLDVATVLRALSDPVRLELVRQLRASDVPIACGTFDVTVAKNTLSHHFKTLREAGVIVTHRQGTQALNTLQEDELNTAFPGLLDAILPR
ncbi:helix-turn-helix transcriptional regulator [Microlunatus sp. Gsoil 973]|uniref:ArsR/SmtB family transcription factor n=1 Tax=Microlunatus sp. Gsoil 973 TaxID=2672569 RepID=UPI0012B48F94|nr:helix-turn-helix domain-containing protein [Microlunatus sp. Gsoil 973]QGN34422.1 helix-turn-helix domain-containing protein [Microlunatus sp. Gsoil 973]